MNNINEKPNWVIRKLFQSAVCASLATISIGSIAQTADFIVIKGLVTEGSPYSNVGGMSDDGTIVTGTSAVDGGGVVHTAGKMDGPLIWGHYQAFQPMGRALVFPEMAVF